MCKWFKEMNCYIMADKNKSQTQKQSDGSLSPLEKSYRNYAAIFEKVKLVINKDQAKEHYLNYPHVCSNQESSSKMINVSTALKDADSEAVFIGSASIKDFPLHLLVNLIKSYQGESFLGYVQKTKQGDKHQPLFGIYNRNLAEQASSIDDFLNSNSRFLDLPDEINSDSIGF